MPEAAYRFRHALIQEAIYGGMVRSQRRKLHARAAWGLEAASAERLEEVAAVLGYHYAAAGENERAVNYFELAGDHAISVSRPTTRPSPRTAQPWPSWALGVLATSTWPKRP